MKTRSKFVKDIFAALGGSTVWRPDQLVGVFPAPLEDYSTTDFQWYQDIVGIEWYFGIVSGKRVSLSGSFFFLTGHEPEVGILEHQQAVSEMIDSWNAQGLPRPKRGPPVYPILQSNACKNYALKNFNEHMIAGISVLKLSTVTSDRITSLLENGGE